MSARMEQAVKISRTGFVSAGRRLARDIRGVAAIEMAFIFPVMVILYIGLVDVTNLLMVNRRVTLTTSTLADLVTQSDSTITMADIDGVFESARAIFEPMPVDGISLNLWAFRMEDGSPTLQWQYTNGIDCGSAPAGGDEMETLMEDGNDIVVGRVCYYHDAILGTLFSTQTFQLEDEFMLRPRQSTTLDCSDCPAG